MREIELDITDTYDFFSPYECDATLIFDAAVQVDSHSGEAWGRPYNHREFSLLIENAMIFITDQDGETRRELSIDEDEVYEYIDTDSIMQQLED